MDDERPGDDHLCDALRGDVTRLLERHLASPREWMPHEQIDWGEGESFRDRPWSPEDYPLPDGVRSSIYVNLLTEDNLPYYTTTILRHAPHGHPLRDWTQQWTTEENRHAMVMRDWVHISRCLDPVALEVGRRAQMSGAHVPEPETLADLVCYVTLQERATQIAHRNTAAHLPKEDRTGRTILGLVAGDETKHFLFYRDLGSAAFSADPSVMMQALSRQVENFAMPGVGIPQFTRHAVRIAREGIYGLGHFVRDVVEPVLAHWDLDALDGLTREATRAKESLQVTMARLRDTLERAAAKATVREPGSQPA